MIRVFPTKPGNPKILDGYSLGVAPLPSNTGRFIGIPGPQECNNPGGHCPWKEGPHWDRKDPRFGKEFNSWDGACHPFFATGHHVKKDIKTILILYKRPISFDGTKRHVHVFIFTLSPIIMVQWKMGPSNFSFFAFKVALN